jgi:hypothetical protein
MAVVAAILIAFAIDASWDARKTAEDTREALLGLEAELVENLDLVSSAVAADRRIMSVSDEILTFDESSVSQVPPDSAATLIRALFDGITLNPSEGAINSLLATGAFEEIRSSELRAAIAALPGVFDDQREEVDQIWMGWRRFVDRGIATGTHSSATAIARESGTEETRSDELLSLYVRDMQFREIIADLGSIMDFYARELDGVRSKIELTLSLLRQELG